jgi:hypothetical protein
MKKPFATWTLSAASVITPITAAAANGVTWPSA